MKNRTVLLLLNAVLWAAPLLAADEDWLIEHTEKTQAVTAGSAVRIVNPYGDVRCRGTEGEELLLVGNAQRHQDDPRRPVVEVREEDGTWHVEVVYPELAEEERARLTPEMERRRFDLSILLPAFAPVTVRTTDGLIEAKGLRGAADVSSEKGRIFLRTAGTVRAHTDSGELEVMLRSTDWTVTPELSTLTGDVTLWLPPQPSTRVEAETHGEISTDFSIEISRRKDLKKMAVAEIGEGTGRLVVRSEKGRVRLFESRW